MGGVSPEICWASNKYEMNFDTWLHLVAFFIWTILWCTDPRTSSSELSLYGANLISAYNSDELRKIPTVQCLWWSVASPFNEEGQVRSRPIYVSFLADKMSVGQVFTQLLPFSFISRMPPLPQTHFHLNTTLTRRTLGQILRTFEKK